MSAGRTALAIAAGVFVTAAGCAAASFSAEFMTVTGKTVSTGKVYVQDKKVRRETKTADGMLIVIVRADKGVTWVIRPWKKEYTESKRAQLVSPDPDELSKSFNAKEAGEETIAGFLCKKTIYTPRDEQGATITVWMSYKLKWPLKVQVNVPGGGSMMQYKNIQLKRLDAKLFEVPAGYKNVTPAPRGKKPNP